MSDRINQYDYVAGDTIRLRNDNVIVELITGPEQTASGLWTPDPNGGAINGAVGIVRQAGPGPSYIGKCDKCQQPTKPTGMTVKPGDRVVLESKHAGDVIHWHGKECRVVREAEILCVVGE